MMLSQSAVLGDSKSWSIQGSAAECVMLSVLHSVMFESLHTSRASRQESPPSFCRTEVKPRRPKCIDPEDLL
jgi:hypothetical protein